jgi:deazaflavin-dependent oxidoreductase (nitroreductase family)
MAGEVTNIHPSVFQRFIHRLLMLRWVSAFLAKVLYRLDKFLFRLTRGRFVITRLAGLPIIQLTTTGAKTGQARTMPLVGIPDGEKIALVASNFGQKRHPGWYHNLKVNPVCLVRFDGKARNYIAHEANDVEHEKYFLLAISYYAGYQKYKERAAPRKIPVIVLEPKR